MFYVNKTPRILVKDVLSELARSVWEDEEKRRKLRLLEISSHRVVQIVDDDTAADTLVWNTSAPSRNTYFLQL